MLSRQAWVPHGAYLPLYFSRLCVPVLDSSSKGAHQQQLVRNIQPTQMPRAAVNPFWLHWLLFLSESSSPTPFIKKTCRSSSESARIH